MFLLSYVSSFPYLLISSLSFHCSSCQPLSPLLFCRLLQRQRKPINRHQTSKKGWNQVPPGDLLVPEQNVDRAVGEGPDSLVPFPLLNGIALFRSHPASKRSGHMDVLALREAMKELHSKASK